MRIALLGPFAGPSLTQHFDFESKGATPLPPGYPGAPLMSVLARALVDRGHEVAAISTDYSSPTSTLEPFRRFESSRLTAYFCPQRGRTFRSASGMPGRSLDHFAYERRCLLEAINDWQPEFIHAHWTYEFVWAALDSGVPTLATAHDSPAKVLRFTPNLYRLFRYFMARRVIPRCPHLTAVSPDLANDLRAFTPVQATVVPNPISEAVLHSPGCTPGAFDSHTFVMVLNGWNKLKNASSAFEAFQLARRVLPQLRMVCFGSGYEDQGPAAAWARQKNLGDGIEFKGPVPHATILEQMRHSTALVHPSRWEACCMSIAEAMSVGLPVIGGRDTDGVPWQLDEGRAGALVDVTDPQNIAASMLRLSRERELWDVISMASRDRAHELFAQDKVVDRYLALYAQALARPVEHGAAAVAS